MPNTQPYCEVTDLRAQINKNAADDDTILEAIILAASRAIDGFCNRPDGFIALTTAVARLYSGSGTAVQRIDECTAITLVEVKDSVTDTAYVSWAAGDWLAFRGSERDPDFNSTPYTGVMVSQNGNQSHFISGQYTGRQGFRPTTYAGRALPTVRITARWGYSDEVPDQVRQAAITQSARWYKRAQSSWADTLANGDVGMLLFRKSLDPDVQMMLENSRLIRVAIGGKNK